MSTAALVSSLPHHEYDPAANGSVFSLADTLRPYYARTRAGDLLDRSVRNAAQAVHDAFNREKFMPGIIMHDAGVPICVINRC